MKARVGREIPVVHPDQDLNPLQRGELLHRVQKLVDLDMTIIPHMPLEFGNVREGVGRLERRHALQAQFFHVQEIIVTDATGGECQTIQPRICDDTEFMECRDGVLQVIRNPTKIGGIGH